MIRALKVFAKIVAVLFTILFLLLLFTGVLSDFHSMMTVSDEESTSLFMEDTQSWDSVHK